MSIKLAAQALTHSMGVYREHEIAIKNRGTTDAIAVRAKGGFVKLSDRLLVNLLNDDQKGITRKKGIAPKKEDPLKKRLATKNFEEERSRIFSICIEFDLSWSLARLHIGSAPYPQLSFEAAHSTAGEHGWQAKGLCMFDTSVIEERWGPHFHKFPELPPELRVKIWQFALPRKRVLAMKEVEKEILIPKFPSWKRKILCAPNSIFPLLHANLEAREEALRFYKLSFGNKFEWLMDYQSYFDTSFEWLNEHRSYFDTSFDTVYLGHKGIIGFADCLQFFTEPWMASVTSIALSTTICRELASFVSISYSNFTSRKARIRENLSNLKVAYCISGQDPSISTEDLMISDCPCGSVGSLTTEEIQALEQYLGVKLSCGEIIKR